MPVRMLGISDYLWRLLPANPILLNVVKTGRKRNRDLLIRCGYLGLLVLLVVFSLMTSSTTISGASLSDLTKTSSRIFATASGASANWSNFSKNVSSFIQQSRRWR